MDHSESDTTACELWRSSKTRQFQNSLQEYGTKTQNIENISLALLLVQSLVVMDHRDTVNSIHTNKTSSIPDTCYGVRLDQAFSAILLHKFVDRLVCYLKMADYGGIVAQNE